MRPSLVRSPIPALLLLLSVLLVAVGGPARASAPDPGQVLLVPTPGVGEMTARSSPALVAAIQRDLHLTRAEATTRIGRQHAAGAVEARAKRAAGRYFAGSWLSSDGSALMVAVTDQRAAQAVRTVGATPSLVSHRRGELELARLKLRDRAGKPPGKAVHGWHVDARRNRLVVSVAPGAQRTATAWVAGAGVPAGLVAYETSREPSKAIIDVVGGEGFLNPRGGGCSTGFGVIPPAGSNGFITAGHCVFGGDAVRIRGQQVGLTAQSSFPTTRGPDRAFVRLDVNNPPLPLVKTNFGDIPVLGSQAARVGDTLCSYGDESKFRCGQLITTNRDLIVNFQSQPQATILGLNEVNFCSSGGDSGGPVISATGGQAQGTAVSTTCNNPPNFTTSYQPINKTLLDLRLKLLVQRGVPFPFIPPPVISLFFCESFGDYGYARFTCELSWDGGTDPDEVQISSNGSWARRINDLDQNYVLLYGTCNGHQDTHVSVSVFDADGRRADANQNSFCPR